MSRTKYKYLPKWKLGKFFHNKLMHQLKEKSIARDLEPVEEDTRTEEQKLLDQFDNPDWLYDNVLISYEELLKRKNAR